MATPDFLERARDIHRRADEEFQQQWAHVESAQKYEQPADVVKPFLRSAADAAASGLKELADLRSEIDAAKHGVDEEYEAEEREADSKKHTALNVLTQSRYAGRDMRAAEESTIEGEEAHADQPFNEAEARVDHFAAELEAARQQAEKAIAEL